MVLNKREIVELGAGAGNDCAASDTGRIVGDPERSIPDAERPDDAGTRMNWLLRGLPRLPRLVMLLALVALVALLALLALLGALGFIELLGP